MNTFKFNTEDTEAEQSKFPYPKELREEDQFLAEVVATLAPCVRAMQAKKGASLKKGEPPYSTKLKRFLKQKKAKIFPREERPLWWTIYNEKRI